MAYKVEWSPEAVEDVGAIAENISRDSEFYAASVTTEFFEVSRGLANFPRRGRVVPEAGDEAIRERFIHSYRMIYRVEPNRVLIVAVIHGKRDPAGYLWCHHSKVMAGKQLRQQSAHIWPYRRFEGGVFGV